MRFLFAFVAVLGYASAGLISPLVYGVNPGDAQAAAIDTSVAVQVINGSRNVLEAREKYNLSSMQPKVFQDLKKQTAKAHILTEDTARAINENHARANEAAILYNTEAVRQSAEASRDLHENAYWNGVAASQNYVAAAQSQAAALDGVAHAARAAHLGAPIAPLGLAPYGIAPYGLGLHAW